MAKMRVMQVSRPKGPFELAEREIPEPGPGAVRIMVQACGICHSDSFTKDGLFPGVTYPRVPGHEVAGVIDALGPGAADPLEVPPMLLIGGRRSITGWPSGRSIDSEDTLRFSAQTGVRPMTEEFPLERAAEAYDRMMSGRARFRVVLTTGQ